MLNPLLDAPPSIHRTLDGPARRSCGRDRASAPNLLLGVLRRWPWLLLGLAAGLVLGLLYHMQRPPVYQSTAQLLVIKNRPGADPTGGHRRPRAVRRGLRRDAGALPQVRANPGTGRGASLDNQKPFQVGPRPSEGERVGFLTTRFAVAREKEPGSNTFSNILQLTFKAPHPADAPKYLRAIIEAYRERTRHGLRRRVEGSSSKRLEREIKALKGGLATTRQGNRQDNERQASRGRGDQCVGISQEELSSVRAPDHHQPQCRERTEAPPDRDRGGARQHHQGAGTTRATRLAVMNRLGIPPDSAWLFGPDTQGPGLDARVPRSSSGPRCPPSTVPDTRRWSP